MDPHPSNRAIASATGASTIGAVAALSISCAPGVAPLDPRLGGQGATVVNETGFAYTFPLPALTRAEREEFAVGNNFFSDNWVTAPSSTTARDGLGPTFNARACGACHTDDGRGRPPLEPDEDFLSALVRVSVPGEAEDGGPLEVPGYGTQIQPFGIAGVPGEATPRLRWEPVVGAYADGTAYELVRPVLTLEAPSFGAFPPDVLTSIRVAPAMIGLGLLEAIPETTLDALADPDDRDGDGISGRVHRHLDGDVMVVGRFGWKATAPSVRAQSAGAFLGDMGITTSLHPTDDCPEVQVECRAAYAQPEPEAPDAVLDPVVFYGRTLAVPAMRGASDPEVIAGSALFDRIGCAACHVRELETGDSDIAALAHQRIQPFTDLLLHDMGEGLADARPDHDASGSEWRTPPLWGVGLVPVVNRHDRYLHDGRARGLEEAILWHGGEAAAARDAFRALSAVERARVVRFLEAL
ncbi:MAG: di-heme oxidoredictase family protein [Sandaracinaceae bacterium]